MTVQEVRTNVQPCAAARLQSTGRFRPHSLVEAVLEAVRKVDERALTPIEGANGILAFDTKALLAMLTVCYARQIYGSAKVVARLRRDVNLRGLRDDEMPDTSTLCRFRSANRQALSYCLENALRHLAKENIALGVLSAVSEQRLTDEARRRIIIAMLTDNIEMDMAQAPGAPAGPGAVFGNGHAPVRLS